MEKKTLLSFYVFFLFWSLTHSVTLTLRQNVQMEEALATHASSALANQASSVKVELGQTSVEEQVLTTQTNGVKVELGDRSVLIEETQNRALFIPRVDLACSSSSGFALPDLKRITPYSGVAFTIGEIDDYEYWTCAFTRDQDTVVPIVVYGGLARTDLMPFPCKKCHWNVDTTGFSLYNEEIGIVQHVYTWTGGPTAA